MRLLGMLKIRGTETRRLIVGGTGPIGGRRGIAIEASSAPGATSVAPRSGTGRSIYYQIWDGMSAKP
jgi:hypothetical protein